MAKELLIVFVYDCELCKKEDDDPQDAIIYFYPSWVNEEQRHALCSQLMGVTQFCKQTFSLPKIISLQSGKFSLKKLGRYAICVGTDRNIPDKVLETRSNVLLSLIKLFHKDIESLQVSLNEDEENLSDKLSELLHVYLPILQFATNTFGNIPVLKLPKSSSSVFLGAIQTLQSFQQIPGVLGGVLLYQNKVVASQLNYILTKQLVVSDPYRIKLPVQNVIIPFHLPLGVQLLNIFIPQSEVNRLRSESQELLSALKEIVNWRKETENIQIQNNSKVVVNASVCPPDSSTSTYGGMKRDVSRIFTVPEEIEGISPPSVPDLVRDAVKARHLARIDSLKTSNFMVPVQLPTRRMASTTDDIISLTNKLAIRYYSLGLPAMNPAWFEEDSPKSKHLQPRPYYNTICDPKYPLFKTDGLPASHFLCESRLTGHYESLKYETASAAAKTKKSRPNSIGLKLDEVVIASENKQKLQKAKRSFTLPLKPTAGPISHGIPLTPLMAKLSLLAEEGDRLETPLKTPRTSLPKQITAKTPIRPNLVPMDDSNSSKEVSTTERHEGEESLANVVLYVFGVNNISLLLIIEPDSSNDPDIIHSLWERSVNVMKEYEPRLITCLETGNSETVSSDYSYAVVDSSWDGPVERGGPYQPHHLELLTTLHHTMKDHPAFTHIIVRSEDTLSYGYQCGGNQVFYQESCVGSGGLPTPADLMAVVPLKARRVLERDHGILLL